MPTPTYDLIASNVLSSSASSVTFSSIPATYRDLVLVCEYTSDSGENFIGIRLNSDSDANYSQVLAEGSGSAASSSSSTGNGNFNGLVNLRASTTNRALHIFQIMDYSATDKHKTMLLRANSPASRVNMAAGRWANTAAVNTVTVIAELNQIASGSTFYLYGIVS